MTKKETIETDSIFDVQSKLISLKGKAYLPVQARVAWFRHDYPANSGWTIHTRYQLSDDHKSCISTAQIMDPTGRIIATGTKREDETGFADFIEKSETGAIGRALALCGYGTQFATELEEDHRIVDAPTDIKVHSKPATVDPGDMVLNYASFKNKGLRIKDLPTDTLQQALTYWSDRCAKDKSPPSGPLLEELNAIKKYLELTPVPAIYKGSNEEIK